MDEARLAVEIARRVGDPALIAFALGHLRGCMWRPENPHERLEISTEMLENAIAAGDLSQEFDARIWISIDHLDLGHIVEYESQVGEMERLAAVTRQPFHLWFPAAYRANIALYRGDLERGERLMQAAMEIGQRANAPEAALTFAAQSMSIRPVQGAGLEELIPLYRALSSAAPNVTVYRWTPVQILVELGRSEEAVAELDELLPVFPVRAIPRDFVWMAQACNLAMFSLRLQRADLATECLELLEPYADLNNAIASILSGGSVAAFVALAYQASGDFERAESYFERAIAHNTEMSHVVIAQNSRRDFARMLVQRDAYGDRDRAMALVQEALEVGQRIGLGVVVRDCLELKLQLQGIDSGTLDVGTSIDRVARAASENPPAVWRDAVAPDGTVTIMFSDCKSSA